MRKSNKNTEDAVSLRLKAEQLLKNNDVLKTVSPIAVDEQNRSEADSIKLLHELEVHRIELEMQNEELLHAKEKAETNAEKYTDLYNFAPSGYFTLDHEFRVCELNFNGAKMLGKERSKLINSNFNLFVAPDERIIFTNFLEKVLETKTNQSCGVRLIINEVLAAFVQIEAILVENEDKFILTVIDISKIKHAEIELIKVKEKALESNRLKSAFLANMSHEIRTPMNGILGFADLLKEPDLTGEEQQNYIRIIEKGGARMLNVINDIISISKIESGSMAVDIKESNINEQIEYVYTFFKPEVQTKGVRFSFKNALSLNESFVDTDKEKLFAILTNLVKNAIKYTESGSIELGYTKKGQYIEFYVKDTGVGIDNNRQDAIFERFIQADITDKNALQGAGLGLSISKAYVEMLGGKLWVASEKGKGSIFYFTIPYNVELKIAKAIINDSENEGPEIKNLKILIVEDDEISYFLTRLIVKGISREILHAKDGYVAIELCRNNPDIDLILMDIKMPIIDGYEATRQIRQFNTDIIIIAQTAFAFSGDKEKAKAAGCNKHLSKPINKNKLLSMIAQYFSK